MPQGAHPQRRERAGAPRAAVALLGLLIAAGALGAACDQGTQHDQPTVVGPALHVVGTNVDGAKQIPANGQVQIAFDRFLHPNTIFRQSFILTSESGTLSPTLQYDPVARIVSLSTNAARDSPTPWLTPGVTYRVTMPVPAPGVYNAGPRAIDGATLDAPVTIDFIAGPAEPNADTNDRPIDFCDDVLPIFQNRCSGGPCHATPLASRAPAEGLVLQTATGIANTAIGRASQESNTGARAGQGQPAGLHFGVDMPIVDATGNPANSWLMYKVLLGKTRPIDQGLDAGASACGPQGTLPGPALKTTPKFFQPLGDDERDRLAQFMIGNAMPYPLENLDPDVPTPVTPTDDESSTLPCTFEELERIRAWIADGAQVEQCSACPE